MTEMTKIQVVARKHFEAEEMLRTDIFGFKDGTWMGAGSSIECLAYEAGYSGEDNIHKFVAEAYGYTEWLAHLQDAIFEGLEASGQHKRWHVEIADAISKVRNWGAALHRVHCANIGCCP